MHWIRLIHLSAILGWSLTLGCGCSDAGEERPPIYESSRDGTHGLLGGQAGAPQLGSSTTRDKYPSGPYGLDNPELGQVVKNVSFQGFFPGKSGELALDGDFKLVSLQDLRKTEAKYLIINVSAIWCGPCLHGATNLAARKSEAELADTILLEFVLDGSQVGADPSVEELSTWIQSADLGLPTVRAGDDSTRSVFAEREHAYVVELDTMTVVWTAAGFYRNTTVADEAISAVVQHQNQ